RHDAVLDRQLRVAALGEVLLDSIELLGLGRVRRLFLRGLDDRVFLLGRRRLLRHRLLLLRRLEGLRVLDLFAALVVAAADTADDAAADRGAPLHEQRGGVALVRLGIERGAR